MYVYPFMLFKCLMLTESRREYEIPWRWSYRWLKANIWIPGIKPVSSLRMIIPNGLAIRSATRNLPKGSH